MEKNIKDYLHLYLGCEVKVALYSGTARLIGIEQDCCYLYNQDGVSGRSIASADLVKPILRKLSDATDEEKDWIDEHENFVDNYKSSASEFAHEWDAEKTHYLLSRHFDLFDLIPAGLAIDSTTLNK